MCIEQFQQRAQDLLFCSLFLPLSSPSFVDDKKLYLEGFFFGLVWWPTLPADQLKNYYQTIKCLPNHKL